MAEDEVSPFSVLADVAEDRLGKIFDHVLGLSLFLS